MDELDALEKEHGIEGPMHSYDFFGDCIALSPIIFGEPGAYIQSDMQFAQEAIKAIRDLPRIDPSVEVNDTLTESISMSILSRFFVQGGTHDMVASELSVEFGLDLQIEQEEFLSAMPPEYREEYD